MRLFAIGDIHGCSRTLRRLLIDKIGIRTPDEIICVGDYIDRGPDSRGVVDFLLDLRSQGFTVHTLRGNHEQLMLDSEDSDADFEQWTNNGGYATLKSFGVRTFGDLDPAYRDFFESTQLYLQKGKYIFVHAGLDFVGDDPFQNTDAMLWIRYFEVDPVKLGDRTIIHGHTPMPVEAILEQPLTQRINIDGGCVYPRKPGLGTLVALEVEKMRFICLANSE